MTSRWKFTVYGWLCGVSGAALLIAGTVASAIGLTAFSVAGLCWGGWLLFMAGSHLGAYAAFDICDPKGFK